MNPMNEHEGSLFGKKPDSLPFYSLHIKLVSLARSLQDCMFINQLAENLRESSRAHDMQSGQNTESTAGTFNSLKIHPSQKWKALDSTQSSKHSGQVTSGGWS